MWYIKVECLFGGLRMVRYVFKKLLYHMCACLLVWFLIAEFSAGGRLYAGWFAGFLGACYLLAGWLSYLKSKGTDLAGLLRRKSAPETPYYLRGAGKERRPRLRLSGIRHAFDDGLAEAEEQDAPFPKATRYRLNAVAWAVNGVLQFVLSAL